MARYDHISIAIPMMEEEENIPLLINMLRQQTYKNFTLYCCINQEEIGEDICNPVYLNNQRTISLLQEVDDIDIRIIDRSTPGLGWTGKKKGVGWARKLLFARIMDEMDLDEIVVSLDADTQFSSSYLSCILEAMNSHPEWSAIAVPYYHPLSGKESQDRAMLRYECYMRHYLINLLLIDNPYAFSALGSAMVFPLWAYKRVGGITPMQAGEDFYLMQKFAKTGVVGNYLSKCVRPQGRISHRVPFGTGPAIAKGVDSMDSVYPFYSEELFKEVGETFAHIPDLFGCDCELPMSAFLRQQLKADDLWSPLRSNFKSVELFSHAAIEKIDGLRILQFLRQKSMGVTNSIHNLISFCNNHGINVSKDFSFTHSDLDSLIGLRQQLFEWEMHLRQSTDKMK